MVRVKRKITHAEVTMVALCKRGLNGLQTLFKGDGARLTAMVKSAADFDERGELLAVVAVPGLEFADGDFFPTAESVRKAAHAFMRHGAALDMSHNLVKLGADKAFVAESFIIAKGDPRFAGWKNYDGKVVDVTNGWGMAIQINSPELRKSYRDGEWDGVSLFAPEAQLETVAEKAENTDLTETLRGLFKAAGLTKDTDEESDDMTEEQMKALAKAIVDGVTAVVKPAPVVETEVKAEDSIPFVGNPAVKADLVAHAAKVKAAALAKSGDLNDPTKIAALIKEIEAAEVDPKVARAALHKSDPTLAAALDAKDAADARIAELTKTSNQPPSDDKVVPANDSHPLVKSGLIKAEMVPVIAAARAAAHDLNVRLGRVPATAK